MAVPGRQHLLGVRRQAENDVFISLDPEVESPVPVDTCLPDASRFVILLGVQRGMPEIAGEEKRLLVEGLLDLPGGRLVAANEPFG